MPKQGLTTGQILYLLSKRLNVSKCPGFAWEHADKDGPPKRHITQGSLSFPRRAASDGMAAGYHEFTASPADHRDDGPGA